MAINYNLENIRILLTEGFSDRQLRRFCFDTPHFRPVYEQLAQNSGKDDIVDQILDYADRTLKIDIMLAWAKRRNPARYTQHQPYYGNRILLVDDEEDWRIQLGELLRDLGYEVITTSSKEETMRCFNNDEAYNLVILDMRLDNSDEENKDGLRLGEWLRNNSYEGPIIIMSAYVMNADTIRKMTLQPLRFIVVEKGKIRTGDSDDLLRQIDLVLPKPHL